MQGNTSMRNISVSSNGYDYGVATFHKVRGLSNEGLATVKVYESSVAPERACLPLQNGASTK